MFTRFRYARTVSSHGDDHVDDQATDRSRASDSRGFALAKQPRQPILSLIGVCLGVRKPQLRINIIMMVVYDHHRRWGESTG